jgi:hypothetical protein
VFHPSEPYRWLACLVAVTLLVSTVLGLMMAWRVSGGRTVALLLGAGFAIPVVMLLFG